MTDFECRDAVESIKKRMDRQAEKWSAFWKESERGFAVLACSYFESFLEEAIDEALSCLPEKMKGYLRGQYGGKTGLFKKICFAYTVGLLNEEMFRGLITATDIRNKFAHGKDRLSFDDKEIFDELEKLKFVGNWALNWQQYGGFFTVAEEEIRENVKHVREHYKNRPHRISRARTFFGQ